MHSPSSTMTGPDWATQVERALHVSDFDTARRLAEQALACAADDPSRAQAVFLAAHCDYIRGATEDGLRYALEAAARYEALGDRAGQAKACAVASRCFLKSGDGGSALDHGLAALRLAAEADPDRPTPALLAALLAVGNVYRSLGQLDTARDYCQQAVDCTIALSDRVRQGAATDTLACIHLSFAEVAREQGRGDDAERHEREAMRCSTQAIQIAREQGHLSYEATAVNNLAEAMGNVGEAQAALQLLEDWARDNPCEVPRVQVNLLETRGRLCMKLGQAPRARVLFELALATQPNADQEINLVSCLASACEALGDHRAALGYFQRFHALHVQLAAEAAQRSARIAAVRLDTERQRERAVALELDNAKLQQHADTLFRQRTDLLLTNEQLSRRAAVAMENMSDAVLISDADGGFVNVNQAFANFHRFQDKSACPRTLVELAECLDVYLANGESVPLQEWAVSRALRGESASNAEFTLRRRDTGQSWIGSCNYAPIRGKDGDIIGSVVTSRDVTDTKQAQLALTQAKEAAEAANRAKSSFLANMSHELRTPLNGIMGMVELARRRASDPRQVDYLGMAANASRHLLEIISDVLDISRIEADRLVLEKAEFRLDNVVQNLEAMILPQIAGKSVLLSMQLATELHGMVVLGDARRLSQVLLNLTGNAAKFTAQGSITVRAMRVDPGTAEAVVLRFEVQDTGIGIAAKDQRRIFEAFEQVDGSSTRAHGGSGLGLAISKRLVNMMDGDIGVDSQPGAGSTFWFTVPMERPRSGTGRPSAAALPSPRALLQTRHAGAYVLLVEDDALNLEVSRGLLEDCGLIVHSGGNGAQAVEQARRVNYDLILMDIQMPVMDGVEATRLIRRLHNNPDVPVIAFTANVFPEDEARCREAGMNGFVGRPVEANALYLTLLDWLDRRRNAAVAIAGLTVD